MTRVLITGASGIVGRHAVQALVQRGVEVHAIGRASKRPNFLPPTLHWHAHDILQGDANAVMSALKPDHLLHLAWVTDHGKFWRAPENLDWVAASLGLARTFVENGGKRIVVSGSCAEYDWNRLGDDICDEHTPIGSSFLYGVAKHSLHQLLASYCAQTNVSFAWGRIFMLYGEGEYEARLVPSVIRALKAGETAKVSHGAQQRDFMSSRDCGRAFAELLLSPITGTLNIASGETVTLRHVIETIHTQLPQSQVAYGALASLPSDPPILVADVTRLKNELRFTPEDTLERGLARLIAG